METRSEKLYYAGKRRCVLVVDDEEINREILTNLLGEEYDVVAAPDGETATEVLTSRRGDVSAVLLDLMMPGVSGLELLRRFRASAEWKQLPVIVVTSDRESEVESLRAGANDFIPKPYPQPDVIRARVKRTIELAEDRQIITATERDELTGLYNPEFFFRYVARFDRMRENESMDAAVVDVTRFRMINERFGASGGDRTLRLLGERLRLTAEAIGGLAARRGGNTFLLYFPHTEDHEKIFESIRPAAGSDPAGRIRLRMGVYPDAGRDSDVIRRFDRAKSAADRLRDEAAGGVAYYDDALLQKDLFEEALIDEFRDAISQKQFRVFFQPKFLVRGERPLLAGAEALVRWFHPVRGVISPGVFIPLFERSGLISELDAYVWNETAASVARWEKDPGFTVPVSVNVSRVDFYNPALIGTLTSIADSNGIDRDSLRLEITESAYTSDAGRIIETLDKLRESGFSIEMDDFGSGYSSLNMVSSLPIDALKLDMLFIRQAFREKKDMRLISIIIDIARLLSVPVIAEGVETEEQVLALKETGCDYIQGYYFAKPMPGEEFTSFLVSKKDAVAPRAFSKDRNAARKKEDDK